MIYVLPAEFFFVLYYVVVEWIAPYSNNNSAGVNLHVRMYKIYILGDEQ